MDINKNQQVNTFLKGMNTDTSDSLLENSQYRYAENVRLSTDKDNNSGELRLVDGTSVKSTFTDKIVYLTSIREYVVVITINEEDTKTWSIHVSKDKGDHWKTIFGPCTEEIWDQTGKIALSGVIRWESDNNIKLYIADNTGTHGIIPIQIAYDEESDKPIPTDFKALSGYQQTPLHAPNTQISATSTGTLNPVKVQYAYRLFKTGGAATTLSPLSKTISLRKEDKGYSYTEKTNKAIEVTIDVSNNSYLDQIQLFRINYVQNGQEPTIHKICEKPMGTKDGMFKYLDYGTNIEQVGVSEFLSYISMEIFPKIIESKGDTLFASNLKYTQDSVDKNFEDYDTRSFSSGNYWVLHNPTQGQDAEQPIEFEYPTGSDFETGGRLINIEDADLCHRQFTNNSSGEYNSAWWHPFTTSTENIVADVIGGKGTNIDWELKDYEIAFNTDGTIDTSYQGTLYDPEIGPKTYKHDETYRFGIVLYDDKGRASSVKWICDVHIPPLDVSNDITIGNKIIMKSYYIRFTIKHVPDKCSGYQIVQCPRTMNDRHVITQGIVGRPYRQQKIHNKTFEYTNYLCATGLMTMQDMVADNAIARGRSDLYGGVSGVEIYPCRAYTGSDGITYYSSTNTLSSDNNTVIVTKFSFDENGNIINSQHDIRMIDDGGVEAQSMAASAQDVVQFASPEYAYQPDDIKDILNTYKSQIKLEHVVAYDTPGTSVQSTYNSRTAKQYFESNNTQLFTGAAESTSGTNSFKFRNGILVKRMNAYGAGKDAYMTFLQSDFHTVGEVVDDGATVYGTNRIVDGQTLKKNVYNDNGLSEYIAFNYIQPLQISSKYTFGVTYPGIQSISYPNVPEWNQFANGKNMRFADDVTPIGTYSFINWSCPLIINEDKSDQGKMGLTFMGDAKGDGSRGIANYGSDADNFRWYSICEGKFLQPLGTGGKCILFKLANKLEFGTANSNDTVNLKNYCLNEFKVGDQITFAPIHIAKITKPVTPYGGYTKYAIENSTYVSDGHYGTFDNFQSPITVDMRDGDGFLGIFRYNASHMWKDGMFIQGATKMSTVYSVPMESDIDLTATYGELADYNASKQYQIQDKPASFDGYSQEKEAYMYNTAYGQIPNVITYSTNSYNEISNFNWDTRIHNSDLKTNGETIDNWLVFKAMNYLDVDSRYGQITDMKLFKDKLLFWQDKAFGIISSNERTALTDTSNNEIILGNGGILQRFDYISTAYGMKPNQFVTTQSNHNLYFWDGYEKEILAYGQSLVPLTTVKSIRNHINKHDEVDIPCMFYDNKNKEVVSSVVDGGAIVYSELIEQFTSIYTYLPLYHTNVLDDMISATEHKLHLHNVEQPNGVELFENEAKPVLQYVVNSEPTMPKVFDIQTFGGRFYGGDDNTIPGIPNLQFKYNTPLKQESSCTGDVVTNREYDFRLDIPRNNNDAYGGRMRGKTMQCEFKSTSNSSDFSLQYIITKYRMSYA